jgi:anti-sigma regulatory factor (Ser/Thr protein kinase)/anti-anti-sigma regulatory factor
MPESSGELNDDKACVTTELRGDVCVVRCLDEEGRDLAADLRAGLERCRESGADAIVLDVNGSVQVGAEAVEVLSAAAEELRVSGGSLIVATEEPAVRATLADAGLVHPSVPPEGHDLKGTGHPFVLPVQPHWEHEFVFPATRESLPAARRRLTALAEVTGLGETELFEFSVAVAEALTNAVVHGSPHGADDDILVRFFCYEDEVAVEVVDGGGGLDATPVCVPEASAVSGRGIHFMRSLCDAVQFTCGPLGTHVLLVKRRE